VKKLKTHNKNGYKTMLINPIAQSSSVISQRRKRIPEINIISSTRFHSHERG
jgi:hypothetical protein